MKFASIYLQNYIGIYNGMGLSEIFINFTLATHRTIIIRGDNGSGKSTIMKALSVFPDSNESFIPGKPAKKEIIILDGAVKYILTFIHGVKANGQRETTKAYIIKDINGISTPLNENGNVTSFKDILYDELGLDPNFESLSQLSTDDRGIADKKPADRKRFVNSILDNLEVYNDIYKTLTKRSTSYKNLINSITTKLGSIGNVELLASNVAGIDEKINSTQDKKDQAIEALANAKAKMEMLDPDGSIQAIMKKIEEENTAYKQELDSIKSIILSSRLGSNISITNDIDILLKDTKAKIDKLNIDNQIKRGQIESLLREKENEANELTSKLQRLQSFEQEWRYEAICDEIASNEAEKREIEQALQVTGIKNILSFSKETYIVALESIHKIAEAISNIKDQCDYESIEKIVSHYIEFGTIYPVEDCTVVSKEIEKTKQLIADLEKQIIQLEADIKVLDRLDIRPSNCTIDTCPYIKEAVIIQNQDPRSAKEEAFRKLENAKSHLDKMIVELNRIMSWNISVTQFNNLIRDIDRNAKLVSKLPCGDIFTNKPKLIDAIFHGNYYDYLESIYRYIDLANLFDQYKVIVESIAKLNTEKDIYESKQEIILEIQRDIERINSKLDEIEKQINPIQSSLAFNDRSLIDLQKLLGIQQSILDNEKERDRLEEAIRANEALYKANIEKINKINSAAKDAEREATLINAINKELNPLFLERDRLNHQMRLVDDYNRELDMLNNQYNIIETIRYYSSPTTGIQLTFMEMYMGKVIQVANNLLSMFFNGQFTIMPFVINENEFRIPCAGDGILNDDISSMSSAQIAMISMILSFSFLYSSSSKYNILKLDEIDGSLDANNRIMFIDVLNNVMNMMGTEQCIMISHNTELQVDDADIILLKSSENNDYMHGNVIWKY